MALTFKLVMGAGAIWSAMLIAVTERTPTVVVEPDFGDRFPVMISPPSPAWRGSAVVPVEAEARAVAETLPAPAPAPRRATSRKVRHSGFVCHRQTYYRHGHRYWRCRR
jgi:hypothetical protein